MLEALSRNRNYSDTSHSGRQGDCPGLSARAVFLVGFQGDGKEGCEFILGLEILKERKEGGEGWRGIRCFRLPWLPSAPSRLGLYQQSSDGSACDRLETPKVKSSSSDGKTNMSAARGTRYDIFQFTSTHAYKIQINSIQISCGLTHKSMQPDVRKGGGDRGGGSRCSHSAL